MKIRLPMFNTALVILSILAATLTSVVVKDLMQKTLNIPLLGPQSVQAAATYIPAEIDLPLPVIEASSSAVTTPIPSPTPAPKSKKPKTTAAKNASKKEVAANPYLEALNNYRIKNGKAPLVIDGKLQGLAQTRASQFASAGAMDNHAGFASIMNTEGFQRLGFWKLAENSSEGYKDPVQLIESAFGGSGAHNANQLNPEYTHVGIGVSGSYSNFVFGGKKI